jgi:hypothetical protein
MRGIKTYLHEVLFLEGRLIELKKMWESASNDPAERMRIYLRLLAVKSKLKSISK